jgi:hypothetical protein
MTVLGGSRPLRGAPTSACRSFPPEPLWYLIVVSRYTGLPRHARCLIERGWTQHADARAADEGIVHPCDGRAVSWSLLGALVAAVEHVAASEGEHAAICQLARTCTLLADIVDTDSLEQWNDSRERTRDDVVAALDQATMDIPGQQDAFPGFSLN